MRGKRLIKSSESNESQQLSEALIKQLTGGDSVTCRFLRQEFFEYKPVGKIFLLTNHKPKITGNDHGIWRRVRYIPFEFTVSEENKDKDLLAKLAQEKPGILAWAVRGCLEWQKRGLDDPEFIRNATAEYRNEMDSVSAFLGICITSNKTLKSAKDTFFEQYQEWCAFNGHDPVTKRKLGTVLKGRGYEEVLGTAGKHFWKGISLPERSGEYESLHLRSI